MRKSETLKILKLLSDDTRLSIIDFLFEGEKCVCDIYTKVRKGQSTVSIQLGKLEKAGILQSRRAGKKVFYRIADYRVCDIFRILGYEKGCILKKECYCRSKK